MSTAPATERSAIDSTGQTKKAPVLLPTPMPYSTWILWLLKHELPRICSKEEALAWAEQCRRERGTKR